jgi:hypothetical protein
VQVADDAFEGVLLFPAAVIDDFAHRGLLLR